MKNLENGLGVAFALVATLATGPALADPKSMPGSACLPVTDGITYSRFDGKVRASQSATFICPIIREYAESTLADVDIWLNRASSAPLQCRLTMVTSSGSLLPTQGSVFFTTTGPLHIDFNAIDIDSSSTVVTLDCDLGLNDTVIAYSWDENSR